MDEPLSFARNVAAGLFDRSQPETLAALAMRHDAIMAALEEAADRNPRVVIETAHAIWRYWFLRGHLPHGRRLLERAMRHCGELPRETSAQGHVTLGMLAFFSGDHDAASAAWQAFVAADAGVPLHRALATTLAGWVAQARGSYDAAGHHFRASLELFRAIGHRWGEAVSLLNLGEIARSEGAVGTAAAHYEACLLLYRELGDSSAVAATLCNLGFVAVAGGKSGAACFTEALAICSRIGNRQFVPAILVGLAADATRSGDFRETARLIAVADAATDDIKSAYEPADRFERDRLLAAAREHLGDATLDDVMRAARNEPR